MGDSQLADTVLDVNFIRPGSLDLTPRNHGEEPQWADDEVRRIEISLGLCGHPLVLNVRRFIPGIGDATARNWIRPDGVTHVQTPLAPYAVDNIDDARETIKAYINDNCLCFAEVVRNSHPAVITVYARTGDYVRELRDVATGATADDTDKELLELVERYCRVWWGIRNMMGSSWLIGDEMLGMKPVYDDGYPLQGKVSCPRQVVQTAGCLLSQAIRPCQALFLEAMREALDPARGREFGERAFFTVFLVTFIVLHEAEDTNKDRERYARQNFKTEKFSMPSYIKDLHESVRRLVHYWLIFAKNLGVDFSTKQTLEASLGFLDKAKRDLVVSNYDEIVSRTSPSVCASPSTWLQDLCFVTHMFDVPWDANAFYQGE
ncbi:hypothetical protein MAPG_10591 [Magnaporthiopsis poae ATCC 64411]|uniref:Uncharacterized protein n=1 Tax=Magnaporthiopsis poae (strain ATCC 64411 / 73-15) TaxID=644358 RepID=A0A0C4ED00_MAGP6|nr:hypothetical protein MAPG_10591 [Magnaporthiopsis poae ATCC 64411]